VEECAFKDARFTKIDPFLSASPSADSRALRHGTPKSLLTRKKKCGKECEACMSAEMPHQTHGLERVSVCWALFLLEVDFDLFQAPKVCLL